ncbi:MAG TPA: hypothetical protein VGX23_00820 [Actinocrinis sp.]|nr:hypothetical protein [Actinocrinis sp.]
MIAQQLAENWPAIVRAGAEAFAGVDHMVVLNGAEGVNDMLAKALTMGGTGLGLARNLLASLKPEADGQAGPNGEHRPGQQIPIELK